MGVISQRKLTISMSSSNGVAAKFVDLVTDLRVYADCKPKGASRRIRDAIAIVKAGTRIEVISGPYSDPPLSEGDHGHRDYRVRLGDGTQGFACLTAKELGHNHKPSIPWGSVAPGTTVFKVPGSLTIQDRCWSNHDLDALGDEGLFLNRGDEVQVQTGPHRISRSAGKTLGVYGILGDEGEVRYLEVPSTWLPPGQIHGIPVPAKVSRPANTADLIRELEASKEKVKTLTDRFSLALERRDKETQDYEAQVQKALRDREEEVKGLGASYNAQVNALNAVIAEQDSKITKLARDLVERDTRVATAEAESESQAKLIGSLQKSLAEATALAGSLKTEVMKLEVQKSDLEEMLEDAQTDVEDAQREVGILTKASANFAKVTGERDQLKVALDLERGARNLYASALDVANLKVRELEQDLVTSRTGVDNLTHGLTLVRDALAKVTFERNHAEGRLRAYEKQKETKSMTITQHPIVKTLESDAMEAVWRTAGTQFVKLAREPLVAVLSRHLGPGDEALRGKIAAFLETEVGTAMLTALLSVGLSTIPTTGSPVPAKLARELRVNAMAGTADVVADVLMGPLRQVMSVYLQGVAPVAEGLSAALPDGRGSIHVQTPSEVEALVK